MLDYYISLVRQENNPNELKRIVSEHKEGIEGYLSSFKLESILTYEQNIIAQIVSYLKGNVKNIKLFDELNKGIDFSDEILDLKEIIDRSVTGKTSRNNKLIDFDEDSGNLFFLESCENDYFNENLNLLKILYFL